MHPDPLRRILRSGIVAFALAGCGQAGATPPAGTVAPATNAASVPTPSPSAVAAAPTLLNPAPPEMLGTWAKTFAPGDISTITITATDIRIVRFGSAHMRLEVFGAQLVLSHSTLCAGEGRYAWSVNGDKLRFNSVTPDPCDGRAKSFDGDTYTRLQPS